MARILLIDDNDLLRTLLRLQLEQAGHELAEAREGAEGLRLYGETPADVVVCDLFMPGKEGLETIRELRQAGARVIAVSGDGPPALGGMLRVAELLGACRTLRKPFDTDTLLQAVGEILAEQTGGPSAGASPEGTAGGHTSLS